MPATARVSEGRQIIKLDGTVPRGMSTGSEELSERAIHSLDGFFASSEVLRYQYAEPSFPLDAAGYVLSLIRRGLANPLGRIQALASRTAAWNGEDIAAPDPLAITHAENWIVGLYIEAATVTRPWLQPHITAGPFGEVVLEWWNEDKKLTVYVEGRDSEYVKVWGSDIESQMADGDAEPFSTRRSLWLWLTS